MSAREAMLGRIRRSLGVSGADVARRAAVADRLARAPRGVVPARGQVPQDERIALFADKARAALADVEMVATADIPAAIARHLAARNLPAALTSGLDPRLARIPWERSVLDVRAGVASPQDAVTISYAEAGIAETGTLMLESGPDNPTLLNFLPALHIAIVRAGDIVGDVESALDYVRRRYGKGVMPRMVNMVTGPSRSGDIEQTMYLGAHGPVGLLVLIAVD
ncbi:MAG: LUD domain-containing protein [Sphingobium sp.]